MGKKKLAEEKIKICNTCANCIYIGEGDYICNVDEPILVMEDHMPNENFIYCGLADWEEE